MNNLSKQKPISCFISAANDAKDMHQMVHYVSAYVYGDGFTEGKRFARFISKAETYVYEEYLKRAYAQLFGSNVKPLYSLEDVVLFYFEEYYENNEEYDGGKGVSLLDSMCTLAACTGKTKGENKKWKMNMVKHPDQSIDGFPSVSELYHTELKEACIQFIREKSMWRGNIDESNYFAALPETPAEGALLMEKILNSIHADIEIIARSGMAREAAENPGIVGMASELQKQNQKLQDKIENLDGILNAKNTEIADLRKQHGSNADIESLQETIDILSEKCNTMEWSNRKLVERHNGIISKYNTLKHIAEETKSKKGIVEEDMDGFKDVNPDGKYIFFATEKNSFQKNLLKEFPNALFFDDKVNLNQMNVDMVVMITSHIKHPVYYSIRNQCKTAGIPFIQCRHTNTDTIKELMWEQVNFGKSSGYKQSVSFK